MKNMKRRIAIGNALFVALWTTQTALAWYDPSIGRWINRDPLGDDGSVVYLTAKSEPRIEPRTTAEITTLVGSLRDPLTPFTRVNANLYGPLGNNPASNIDPYGLDSMDCLADCIDQYRDPVGNHLIPATCNAIGNKLAGPVRGGVPSRQGPGHPTTWQHKVGGKLGSVGSKIGKTAGHGAIAVTVAEGFFDWGVIYGCVLTCGADYPDTHKYSSVAEEYGAF